jgi:predicted ester cyclase
MSSREGKEPQGGTPGMSPRERVNQVIDAFNRHDVEALGACYAEHAVLYEPGAEPFEGREGILAYVSVVFGAFPDVRFEPFAPVIVSGNQAVWQVIARGTFDGPMPQPDGTVLEPNGKEFSLEEAWVSTLDDDGLIVEARAYYDATGFAIQLGLVG